MRANDRKRGGGRVDGRSRLQVAVHRLFARHDQHLANAAAAMFRDRLEPAVLHIRAAARDLRDAELAVLDRVRAEIQETVRREARVSRAARASIPITTAKGRGARTPRRRERA